MEVGVKCHNHGTTLAAQLEDSRIFGARKTKFTHMFAADAIRSENGRGVARESLIQKKRDAAHTTGVSTA